MGFSLSLTLNLWFYSLVSMNCFVCLVHVWSIRTPP
ncbi:hypothetical protein AB205_0054900 [Aquarana catesbeiana]|uniref:Uncharacterized protein n=1 Tax=Aquarana catesbeiana TaxID=8400 RepID=A0A2G9RA07_AQUCT|nr:hypothetical protein AB205_0054900 [Aquarana catesbeiana]